MAEKQKKKVVTFVVGPFRMAFPALFDPEPTDNGERYKMTCLFPPDSKDIPKIEDALYDCMEDAFGPKASWPNGRHDVHPSDKFYDAGKNSKYNGFLPGWMALPVSSQEAPGIVDANRDEVLSKREVYGGRWARAEINVTSYDNKSKGVTAYLNHVQLLENDEAFSGRGKPEDAFDKYELRERDRTGRSGREETRTERGRSSDRTNERERTSNNGRDNREEYSRDRDTARGRDDREQRGRDDRPRGREDDRPSNRDERPSGRDRNERDAPRDRPRSRDERDEGRSRDDRRSSRRDDENDWN